MSSITRIQHASHHPLIRLLLPLLLGLLAFFLLATPIRGHI
jgi:hypothetical protein